MPSASPTTQTSVSPLPSAPPKPFSISLPTSKPRQPPHSTSKPLNPKKRPHSSITDSDSDNEASNRGAQLVSSFDNFIDDTLNVGKAGKAKAPLVIVGLKNRDWRAESQKRRGKNLLPPEVQAARLEKGSFVEMNEHKDDTPRRFGLNLVRTIVEDKDGDVAMVEAQIKEDEPQEEAISAKTMDEEALEALIGNQSKGSTLVLPAIRVEEENATTKPKRPDFLGTNEDDSFRSDVASRPDSASLDQYAAVPIEEFGAALLRGMGWKEGDVVGKRKNQIIKARIVERRPALLGIGAKEVPGGVGDEFGAWGKATRGKRKKDTPYNPVLLRNSKTGEMLTEEELDAKRQSQKREEADWRERRDRNLAINEERKSERRDRKMPTDEGKIYEKKDRPLAIENGKESDRRQREREHEGTRQSHSRRDRSNSADNSRRKSSKRERSRSVDGSRYASSRRERSRSPERKHSRRRDYDDLDRYERREKDHHSRDRRKDDRQGSLSSRPGYRNADREDDGRRRRRQEVY